MPEQMPSPSPQPTHPPELHHYYVQASNYPPLGRPQERGLGWIMERGQSPDGSLSPAALAARGMLILHNQHLVLNCASELLTQNPDLSPEADDLVQVGMETLVKQVPGYRPARFSVVRSRVEPFVRKDMSVWSQIQLGNACLALSLDELTEMPDPTAEASLETTEDLACMLAAPIRKKLSSKERMVVELTVVLGYTQMEAAKVLNITPQAISLSFHRILTKYQAFRQTD